jgi:hypothetical protein
MIALTGYTVFHYLLNRGIVTLDELFAGEMITIDNPFPSSRNSNFIVRRAGGRNLFLKQPRILQDAAEERKELLFYKLVNESNLGLEVHCLKAVPPIDNRNQILVLNHSDETFTFETLLLRIAAPFRGSKLKIPTRQIGRMVSNIGDKLNLKTADCPIPGHHFGTFTPWILTLGEQDIGQIEQASSFYLAPFGRFILQHKALLDELRGGWKLSHLINTDVCWRNILTSGDAQDPVSPYFLIDWEFASVGDPKWEIASLAADYVIARFNTANTVADIAISFGQYLELMPVLLASSGEKVAPNDPDCRKVIQLLGVILMQKYYLWAVEGAENKLVDFRNVFLYAQRCLTQSESVIREFKQ